MYAYKLKLAQGILSAMGNLTSAALSSVELTATDSVERSSGWMTVTVWLPKFVRFAPFFPQGIPEEFALLQGDWLPLFATATLRPTVTALFLPPLQVAFRFTP
jgi:hypothetical protein